MRIAVLTFEGFNELDSFIAAAMINRVEKLEALIVCPPERVAAELMSQLKLDPARQVIAAQCSGALVLAKLGLLGGVPACTDSKTKPWVEEAGVKVLEQPFVAHGNVATAGGCLGSHYLAAWGIARLAGWEGRCST